MSRYFGIPLRNGLPLGLGTVATLRSGGAASWTPLTLFAAGEQGGWYDPSDLSTMFQDSAGTTPVTAVEQPVGLWLDKRLGALSALGPELVTNGDFASATGWTLGVGVSIGSGQLSFATASNTFARQDLAVTAGRTYLLTFTQTAYTSGAPFLSIGLGGVVTIPSPATLGTKTMYVTAGPSDLGLRIYGGQVGVGGTWSMDNISVREVPGNHLIQPTSASRPTYSKRYNLLQYTEAFSDAFWTKTRVNLSTATSPIGTATASDVVPTTDNNTHFFGATVASLTVGATYVWTFRFKANGYRWIRIGTDSFQVSFDSLTGAVGGSTGSPTTSVSDLGNGWYELSVTKASATTSQSVFVSVNDANSTSSRSFAGDGVSGVLVWGFDLRRTIHTTMGMPAYQRVTTATDYDESGFLPRLRFDGADDGMYTAASVNFSATDQMSLLFGGTKLSDTAEGVTVELSTVAVVQGSFVFGTPLNGSNNAARYLSRGSSASQAVSGALPAPSTFVATGLSDISSDTCLFRINGTQVASNTADQGTGNYGNYVLYVGRRNNASEPFNGDIFQLILRGALTSGADLTSAEQYVAARTGVTL